MVKTTINKVNNYLRYTLYILCIIELLLFPSLKNFYGCCIFIINMEITSKIVFKYQYIRKNYISTFILLSYTFCFSFMPLVVTLINNVPLTYKFVVPFQTFSHHFIFQISLVISFIISQKIGQNKNLIRDFLKKHTSYFKPITPKISFMLGIIGLIALIFTALIDIGGLSKLANGLTFLVASPLILTYGKQNMKYHNNYKKNILIFISIVFIIGIASNSRSTMLFLILIVFLIYITQKFIYNEEFNISPKKIILLFITAIIIMGPIADIASAMVLIRQQRSEISPKELFDRTLDIVKDKETLYKMQQAYEESKINYLQNNTDGWSEEYTGNIFLDRFCNLRVSDATLHYANQIGFNNPTMKEKLQNNLLSMLPSPILKLIGINPNIKECIKYSSGDLLYSLAINNKYALGGYKVCGYTGIGLATFGYLFYPIAIFVFIFIFYILDGLILPIKNTTIIPTCTLIQLYTFFYLLNNGDGISRNINFILRGLVQTIIFYLLLIWLGKQIYGNYIKK